MLKTSKVEFMNSYKNINLYTQLLKFIILFSSLSIFNLFCFSYEYQIAQYPDILKEIVCIIFLTMALMNEAIECIFKN